jgi:UDP-glucose 4-epimerase
MSRRVWVTGGAGFIGSHLAEVLLQAGYQVAVLDNLSHGRRENVPPEASFHLVDVRDEAALRQVLAGAPPWAICHLAAQPSVPVSVERPAYDAEVNVLGTVRLLELARRCGVAHFSFASTCAVYGDPLALPCTEESCARPLAPYGLSKWAAEQYLAWYGRNGGPRIAVFRYANVYGPRQDAQGEAGVVAAFSAQMLRGEAPLIHGDGRQGRDFVYVEDVARAHVLALQHLAGGLFNLGTGQEVSVQGLFAALQGLTGFRRAPRGGPARPGDIRRMVLDASRAAAELGWRPQVSLEEGLRRTLDWAAGERGRLARTTGSGGDCS